MITVIPDIHADPQRLEATLSATDGQLAFLGDFIDGGQGACDHTVLTRVRGLIDAGAVAVMGNHELNALLFHRGLRADSPKNRNQHRSFLEAFGFATPEAMAWTDWFLTLPLWLDLDGLRLAHACWSIPDIATVAARRPDGRLQESDLAEIGAESTPFGRAVKRIVSGPEVTLPAGYAFRDHKGDLRTEVRLAWWRNDAATYREAALSVPDVAALPDVPLPAGVAAEIYPADAAPVLVGHYKMTGTPHVSGSAASIDYLEAPCAYRWDGEEVLNAERLSKI
ncbi:hypothetical protein CP157_03883 (plasmid) [Paracoccus marcusii]|uniref:metallophosphoesterase n=1 Tax=Paracoccus marcusii TaxID=59779 RepID=UPI001C3C78B4|nr:metallophosphoesterase [Paracoccus marcusii]QXI66091.1 hypothetical protein CP157_03883 [Paracoccus marcusii]